VTAKDFHRSCSDALGSLILRAWRNDPEIEGVIPAGYKLILEDMAYVIGCSKEVLQACRFAQILRVMDINVPGLKITSEVETAHWKLRAYFSARRIPAAPDILVRIPNRDLNDMVRRHLNGHIGEPKELRILNAPGRSTYLFNVDLGITNLSSSFVILKKYTRGVSTQSTIGRCPSFVISPQDLLGILEIREPARDSETEDFISEHLQYLGVVARHLKGFFSGC